MRLLDEELSKTTLQTVAALSLHSLLLTSACLASTTSSGSGTTTPLLPMQRALRKLCEPH
eukprot:5875114-Amphidinium_carterae.1